MILATARLASQPAAMRCKPTLPHICLQIPQAWFALRRAEHQAMTGKFVIVPGDQVIGKAGGDALPEIGMILQPVLDRAKWRNPARRRGCGLWQHVRQRPRFCRAMTCAAWSI